MKPVLLFCTGMSGSGKSYFIRHHVPKDLFYSLKSATTRNIRPSEVDGREYFFRDEQFFATTPMATHLWVNEQFWTPGMPKWMYGVSESEIMSHLGQNMTYDVIQPRYVREMIDWFRQHNLKYNFKVAYFIPGANRQTIVESRANMPNDTDVRKTNTCDPIDFLMADVNIDFIIKSGPDGTLTPTAFKKMIARLSSRTK